MPHLSYRSARLKLITLGLWPQTRLARFASYLLGIDIAFGVLSRLFGALHVLPWAAATLAAWSSLLTFIVVVLLGILALKWIRLHMMWRLRNRLIVTYMFIGVIPVVLLITMALIAGYLLAGQFATFIATNDIQSELDRLQSANSVLTSEVADDLRQHVSRPVISQNLLRTAHAQPLSPEVTFWYGGERSTVNPPVQGAPPAAVPGWIKDDYRGVVAADHHLWLRVVHRVDLGNEPLIVVSSVPLDRDFITKLAAPLGKVTLFAAKVDFGSESQDQSVTVNLGGNGANRNPKRQVIDLSAEGQKQRLQHQTGPGDISSGSIPPARGSWDREVTFATLSSVADWNSGQTTRVLMYVQTRPSRLYARLFLTLGEFAGVVFSALTAVAIAFGIVELLALIIGIRLTRSMTRSVAELYNATESINRGQFRHRIRVRSYDQLAALEKSFNSMAESLEKLIAEQKEKQRIENELVIAQEVQAQLFPKQLRSLQTLELWGLCQPARTVSGDYYDFLALGHDELGLAIGDVSGKGISAALLMATIHSAVRAYTLDRTRQAVELSIPAMAASAAATRSAGFEREEARVSVAPAELLGMLNRQLFHSTPMEKYATLFFGVYEGASRTLTFTNAGHLPPIILGADGHIRRLEAGGTVAGLFEAVTFDQASVTLLPGDVFISFSDGVTEPENEFGEFGEARLIELVRENRNLPLDRICELVTTAVRDWIGGAEQPGDITLVLARAR
jgi:phosphoserine phosphatase RsbU/P